MIRLIQASTSMLVFEAMTFCSAYFWFGASVDAALNTVFFAGFAACIGYGMIYRQTVTRSESIASMAVVLATTFDTGIGLGELLSVIVSVVACALFAAYTARRDEVATEPFQALFIAALPVASQLIGWPLYRLRYRSL